MLHLGPTGVRFLAAVGPLIYPGEVGLSEVGLAAVLRPIEGIQFVIVTVKSSKLVEEKMHLVKVGEQRALFRAPYYPHKRCSRISSLVFRKPQAAKHSVLARFSPWPA